MGHRILTPHPPFNLATKQEKGNIFLCFFNRPRGLTMKTRSLWREEVEEPMWSGAIGRRSDLKATVWATYIPLPNAIMMMLVITMARNLMLNLENPKKRTKKKGISVLSAEDVVTHLETTCRFSSLRVCQMPFFLQPLFNTSMPIPTGTETIFCVFCFNPLVSSLVFILRIEEERWENSHTTNKSQ